MVKVGSSEARFLQLSPNEREQVVRTSDSGLRDLEELSFDETSNQRRLAYGGLSQEHKLELVDLGVHLLVLRMLCSADEEYWGMDQGQRQGWE